MKGMYKKGKTAKGTEFNFIPPTRSTKMKLFLSILLLCLVSVSYQEHYGRRPLPYARQSRARYVPLFYSNGIPAGYDFLENKAEEILPRHNINDTPLGRLFNNILVTKTSTVTDTVVSTVTTAAYVNCIPSTQFKITVTGSPNAVPPVVEVRNTIACARRRRDVAELFVNADSQIDIHAAEPLPIEASALIDTPSETREIQPVQAELLSSKSDELVEIPEVRAATASLTTTKLVTVSTTSYKFVPQTISATKEVAGVEGLLCLPSGYVVC